MALLLQRYDGLSDADAVDAAENDRRWQLVLGTLGQEKSPFGQGTLVRFRMRAMAHDLDKKLVDRTVAMAKRSGKFGWKALRVALDSSPLLGAGRVEDTWNLVGRAMSKVVHAVSVALDLDEETVIQQARLTVLSASSIKAALDIDWDDEDAEREALDRLLAEVSRLEAWVEKKAKKKAEEPPLSDTLAMLRRVVEQDTEPDPPRGGRKITDGVAHERVVSISDTQMRHGRKSRSKRFDGYKRHIAVIDRVIVATAVRPANAREHEPTAELLAGAARYGAIATLDVDRGYLASPAVELLHRGGTTIHSRAWNMSNRGLFTKADFRIDLARHRVTCPAGAVAPITTNDQVFFDPHTCGRCKLKPSCTDSPKRSLSIHRAEDLLIKLRADTKTAAGRAALRERTAVEHRLARISAIQGNRARYRGTRPNELDLNRSAAVANLLEVARLRCA
jgi:hypothetical protein